MREADVPGIGWAVSWRVNTALAVVGLQSWFAQVIVEQFARRNARHPPGEPWLVWTAFAVLGVLIGGAAVSTWRAARKDHGDVVLLASSARLHSERAFCVLGGFCTAMFGTIIMGVLSEGRPVLPLAVMMLGLLALGLWLLFWSPLVVIDRARGELLHLPLGGWFPWRRRLPLSAVKSVLVRSVPLPNGSHTQHVVAQVDRKELLLDALPGATPEVAHRRRQELLELLGMA